MAKKPIKRYEVSPEKFIEAWQTSSSSHEVAQKLGMERAIVLARASEYRSKGIKLKSFPRGRAAAALNVDDLNKLIEEINQTHGVAPTHQTRKEAAPSRVDKDASSIMRELLNSMGR